MLRWMIFAIICLFAWGANAQKSMNIPRSAVIDPMLLPDDGGPILFTIMPRPGGIGPKQLLDRKGKRASISRNKTTNTVLPPTLEFNFEGNFSQGTPNDNNIGISDSGYIISASNTNFRAYYDTSSKPIFTRTFSVFAKALGSLNRSYDPKVIYDPTAKRFMVVFLNGISSSDNDIIVCFSTFENPSAPWNCYRVPGNRDKDSTWSDYPVIAQNGEDLFITVNKLHDGKGWKDGFVQSVVWQIGKSEGFKGDSLQTIYHDNIRYNGKSIWSICPVSEGMIPAATDLFLLSVRPGDLQNDTVFLHHITGTVHQGNANLTTQVLTTTHHYGLPPSADQPDGQTLETNDTRVLSGIYTNNTIQYVQTAVDTNTYRSAVFYGTIEDPGGSPVAKGYIYSIDTLDIAYPSIAYIGGGAADQSAVITFSFVNNRTWPGTAVIQTGRTTGEFSDPLFVKIGDNSIDVLTDTAERWGDYTGIQRKYNEPGVCWLNGSFGASNKSTKTWIASIRTSDLQLGIKPQEKPVDASVYPNPAPDWFQVDFNLEKRTWLEFSLTDIGGRREVLLTDTGKPGVNRFRFLAGDRASGIYILQIRNADGILLTQKIIIP